MVVKSLSFIRALKRKYGNEKAIEVWDAVVESINDPELTFEVYKCLMNGGFGSRTFTITHWYDGGPPPSGNTNARVFAIKTLRTWTGVGLKESKESVESAEVSTPVTMKIIVRKDADGNEIEIDFEKFERDMRNCNFTIEME